MSEASEWKVDRKDWPKGPWDQEPYDRVEWEFRGFPCMAIRNTFGAWCGYVGVPPGHPFFEKTYSQIYDEKDDVQVHGGLTYTDHCNGHICHNPKPGQPDNVWWLGFDCAHYMDMAPGFRKYSSLNLYNEILEGTEEDRATYRNIDYVKKEVENLARQCRELAPAEGRVTDLE